MLSLNEVETEDQLIQLGWNDIEDSYFDVEKEVKQVFPFKNSILYKGVQVLDSKGSVHRRRVYSIFDFLGDLGGVIEIILLVFGMFLLPIAKHSFILKATKKLYLARTKEESIFEKVEEKKTKVKEDWIEMKSKMS